MNNDNNIQNQTSSNVDLNTVPVQQTVPVPTSTEIPVQQTVPVVNSVPAPAAPVSSDIPVAAEAPVIDNTVPTGAPVIAEEQVVLDNSQKKSGSNFILIVIVLLLVVALMYAEEIMQFVETNIIATNPTGVDDGNGDNLIDGFILLDDVTGSIKVNSIKFYNFKKNNEKFSIGLNYESDVEYDDVSKENLYIEIYDSNKVLLYKHLFDVKEKISRNIVRTYSVELDADVYESAFYALVKTYSDAELSKITNLTCKYRASNEGYNELYKHIFTFKNDMLINYSVDRKVEVSATSTSSTVAINNIKQEYDALVNANLPATYTEGNLVYSIDLENLNADYIPLYKKGTSMLSVKNKEVFKKWECE